MIQIMIIEDNIVKLFIILSIYYSFSVTLYQFFKGIKVK